MSDPLVPSVVCGECNSESTLPRRAMVVLGVVGLSAGLAGCPDRSTDQICYERDAGLDFEPDVHSGKAAPYCRWETGELPEPPKGYAHTNKVFLAFKPTAEQPCDPCDVERFDALLREKIEAGACGDQPYELLRGCYAPAEETQNGSCWVAGLYFSDCKPP